MAAGFVDRVVLHLAGGNGGHGVASVHREKFKPLGGPDGGNGGRGGDVILEVDPSVTTLIDYHFSPHRKATSGRAGQGSNRNGADGTDVTTDAAALAGARVTAEVVAQTKGPKIRIHKFKNKTGYHKRLGHRQKLTQVRVTGITK